MKFDVVFLLRAAFSVLRARLLLSIRYTSMIKILYAVDIAPHLGNKRILSEEIKDLSNKIA